MTVRWKYIDEPSENDWIGVFTPPIDDVYPVNPSEHAPIKWKVTINLMCAIGYSKNTFLNIIIFSRDVEVLLKFGFFSF